MQALRFLRMLLLTLLLIVGGLPMSAAGQTQYGSVDISPTYQELPVGGMADFTVGASSSSGGTVIVSIPAGLDLLGSPVCYSGCRVPIVTYDSDETSVEFNVDGQIGSMGIQVAVNYLAVPGSSLSIGVILVGGPQAVEMSSAFIAVTEAVPKVPAASSDERYAFLDVSPRQVMAAPGGTWTYVAQPLFWGDWTGQFTDQEIVMTIPSPLRLTSDPICGPRASIIPARSTCDVTSTQMGSSTIITSHPRVRLDFGDGVFITATLDPEATADLDLSITIRMTAKNGTETVAEELQTVRVISGGMPYTDPVTPSTVQALLEVRDSYASSSSSCGSDLAVPGQMVGIYEWGGEYPLATSTISTGRVGSSSDLSGDESCFFTIRFETVADFDVYSVAQIQSELEFPCRACYFGIVTRGTDSIQIFTLGSVQ